MKRCTNCKFHENCARDLYSEVWSNFSKILGFGHPVSLSLHHEGEIWHGGVDLHSIPCQFHSHRCNVSPLRGKKKLKIALWVTYIPTLCAAQNAAGNQCNHWTISFVRVTDKAKDNWWRGQHEELEQLHSKGRMDLLYKKVSELMEMKKAKRYSTQILSEHGEVLIENAQAQASWKLERVCWRAVWQEQ